MQIISCSTILVLIRCHVYLIFTIKRKVLNRYFNIKMYTRSFVCSVQNMLSKLKMEKVLLKGEVNCWSSLSTFFYQLGNTGTCCGVCCYLTQCPKAGSETVTLFLVILLYYHIFHQHSHQFPNDRPRSQESKYRTFTSTGR